MLLDQGPHLLHMPQLGVSLTNGHPQGEEALKVGAHHVREACGQAAQQSCTAHQCRRRTQSDILAGLVVLSVWVTQAQQNTASRIPHTGAWWL